MLRMGRSPRVEPNENEKATVNHPPQAATTPTHQTVQPPAPQRAEATVPPPRVEPERSSTPRAVSESESLARDLKDGIMSGFLGSGTTLSGEAEFKGMLRIDGQFTGRIASEKGTLIVSSGARVDADIAVGTAKVNGVVNGDITASERLEMGRSARVRGNVRTPVLVVEQGAIFEGGCRMTQQAEQEKTQKPTVKVTAPQPQATMKPRPATAAPTQAEPVKVPINAPVVNKDASSEASKAAV
jgi:cytoskeletal protein CcmA (bactofilin family)